MPIFFWNQAATLSDFEDFKDFSRKDAFLRNSSTSAVPRCGTSICDSDRDGDRVRAPWGVSATVDPDEANVHDIMDLVRFARRLRFERSRGRVPSLSLPRADG